MKIFISAAEASSDAHGAELLKAIRAQCSESVEAIGIGGPKLKNSGLNIIVDARELLAMGFLEILGHLPKIFRALKQVTQVAEREQPDVAVFIDYPDFHFRLARRFKKLGIPMIYFIPPKVWAWRKGRVRFLKEFFVKILCILPFEEEFYRNAGVSVKYVGNPLVDELPLKLTQSEARAHLGLKPEDRVFILMPGSRRSEVKRHLKIMLEATAQAVRQLQSKSTQASPVRVLIPFPLTASMESIRQDVQTWYQSAPADVRDLLDLQVSQGNAAECMVAADAGLIKSGTSTLEAGLLQCPHTLLYKPNWITAWIFKYLIRYRGPVGLVNLVAGWTPGKSYLVPEFICEQVTLSVLTEETVSLLSDSNRREKMKKGFAALREKVCGVGELVSPSVLAAREVIQSAQWARQRKLT